jgi:hypothetical protein
LNNPNGNCVNKIETINDRYNIIDSSRIDEL